MQSTAELLDAIKDRHNVRSYRKLRDLLGVSQQAISAYRLGRTFFDDDVAIKVAELLDLDPAYVMACAHAERMRSPEVKAIWERIARNFAAVFVMFSLALPALISAVSRGLYIMLSGRRGRLTGASLLLIVAVPAHAGDWTTFDTSAEATYLVLHVADWRQTLTISGSCHDHNVPGYSWQTCDYNETNLILGAHPSRSRVNNYFLLTGLAHVAIAAALPAKWRTVFQVLTIGIEVDAVGTNYRAGINVAF